MARIAETRIKQEDNTKQDYIKGRTDKLCSLLYLMVHEAIFEDEYIDKDLLVWRLKELSELADGWVRGLKD